MRTATSVKWVRLSELKVDPRVNRPIDEAWVNWLIKNWDRNVMGIPSVSQNGDRRYVIIDGQHRVEAMRQMTADDLRVQVEVVSTDSVGEQAGQFVNRNHTRPVQPFQKFEKRVTAGESMPRQIVALLHKHGLRLATGAGDGCVGAVVALEKVGNLDATGVLLDSVLTVLSEAWGTDPIAFGGPLLIGTGRFVQTWPESGKRLSLRLAAIPGGPSGLIGKSRTLREVFGGTLPNAVAEQERLIYNVGLRSGKLDWTT